jgi:enoyl-CoA hydratase/3-hydroxyacyl-CoA dehydrogenase
MAFPETGIGIFPGLGGMLRFSKQVGSELAKYYTFTGQTLNARDIHDLGIAADVVEPSQIESTIQRLVSEKPQDKYRKRELPKKFKDLAELCQDRFVKKLISGQMLPDIPPDMAGRLAKIIRYKAPCALKIANEIIDAQKMKSIPEGIEIELGRLNEIFSTKDALEGLTSLGRKRPEYKGE